jgi:hypothetical protein
MNFVFENLETLENFINCPDKNPSGIKRFTSSPLISTMVRYHQTKEKFDNMHFKNIAISNNPNAFDKYGIASGVTHAPHDWCGPDYLNVGYQKEFPDRKSLFEYVNPVYLSDLQIGKASLILDQSHEGYHVEWLFDWFHNSCTQHKINPKQIVYITGDMDVDRKYKLWCIEKGITDQMCMIPYAHFETAVFTSDNNRTKIFKLSKLPDFDDQYKYKKNNLKNIKTFNALQKRPRAHRMWLFKELCINNLLEGSISSMNWFKWNHTYYMNKTMDVNEYAEIIKHCPMLPPYTGSYEEELAIFSGEDSAKYQMEFNTQITLDTWFSVISEASFGEDTCFISEKTFKLICVHHPFIIFGNKNSLHYLRELGYKTFHPYIDETYDTLECWERLDAIINSIKKINAMTEIEKLEWFKGMSGILEHNYKVMKHNSLDNAPQPMITVKEYFEKGF